MKDLLQISTSIIGAEQVNSVNARHIRDYLGVRTRFNDWIQRAIEKYDFEENVDFYSFLSKTSGRPSTEYIVTLDMAKELCMVENTQKGKETRKYFISFEKQAKNVIQSQSQEILLMKQMLHTIEQNDKRLIHIESNMRIENWQQKKLEDVKNRKVYELAEKHSFKDDKAMIKQCHARVWKMLKKRFSIPRYNELPICEFDNGVSYIQRLTFGDIF